MSDIVIRAERISKLYKIGARKHRHDIYEITLSMELRPSLDAITETTRRIRLAKLPPTPSRLSRTSRSRSNAGRQWALSAGTAQERALR